MNVIQFIAARQEEWKELEGLVSKLGGLGRLQEDEFKKLSKLYRAATSDFAFAQTNFPDHQITGFLNKLVAESHGLIYQRKKVPFYAISTWLFRRVPAIFHQHLGCFFLALSVFVIFFGVGFAGSEWVDEGEKIFLNYSLLDPEGSFLSNEGYILMTEDNIAEGKPFAVYDDEQKSAMASRIMFNNIQVCFLVFAGGVVAGLVTFWILATTGMMVGAFFHIFYRHGLALEFWNTVMLHGMIELTMVVMSAAAGFMIAKGILFPGGYTRRDAMLRMGLYAIQFAIVIAFFLVIAGIFEGFVTGAGLPAWAKLVLNGASFILLFTYWLVLAHENMHFLPRNDEEIRLGLG
ncbi:MAG: stage II sporulation protein M [Bacteroidia bacterium]|nr:stage II sporulation protein M [Bacteroidia bacterium]